VNGILITISAMDEVGVRAGEMIAVVNCRTREK
jgi:hypothetical protein